VIRWANRLLLLAVLCGVGHPVRAAECPTPDVFVIPDGWLPATKQAIAKRALTILILGGAATLGGPAQGAEFTYPSRLVARLRDAFPGLTIKIVVRAVSRQSDADLESKLVADLAAEKPALVIWGPGTSAAGRGDDLDTFIDNVTGTVDKIRAADSDLILMTLQYAPSVARVINLFPYRVAVLRAGEMAGVPVMDRYELMRFWSDNNFLDLDATEAGDRVQVARKLYDCMAEILTGGIVGAVRSSSP
jgi:acyl-CoA thioesterase I